MTAERTSSPFNIKVRHMPDGKLLRTIYPEYLNTAAMSADGKIVAAASMHGPLYFIDIWTVGDGQMVRSIPIAAIPGQIALSPDGTYVAVDSQPYVNVWRVSDGSLWGSIGPSKYAWQGVSGLEFSQDSSTLVCNISSQDNLGYSSLVGVANMSAGSVHFFMARTGHDYDTYRPCWGWPAVSPDGSKVALMSVLPVDANDPSLNLATVALFDLATGSLLDEISTGTRERSYHTSWRNAWRANGIFVSMVPYTSGQPCQVTKVDPSSRSAFTFEGKRMSSAFPLGFSVTRDGSRCAFGGDLIDSVLGQYGVLGIHDGNTGELLEDLTPEHNASVNAVVFSPDSTVLATGSSDGTVKLWDRSTGDLLRTISAARPVSNLQFSSDSSMLAVSESVRGTGIGSSAEVIRVSDGKLLLAVNNPSGVKQVLFTPDGQRLIALEYDAVRMYSLESGSLVANAGVQGACMALSSDGSNLAVGGYGYGYGFILNGADLSYRTVLMYALNGAFVLKFTPDGSRLIVGNGSSIQVLRSSDWQMEREIRSLSWYPIYGLDVDPTGTYLAAGVMPNNYPGDPTRLNVWRLSDGELVRTYDQETGGPSRYYTISSVTFSPDGRSLAYGRWDSAFVVARNPMAIPLDAPPTAVVDTYLVNEDKTLTVSASGLLGNDTDADGDPLTATLVVGPANGSVVLGADGSFAYTPSKDFNGEDSFTYKALDGKGGESEPATVTITVTPVNDAPSFVKGTDQAAEEDAGAQSVTCWATEISAGPTDESGQSLDFVVSNDNNALFSDQPTVSPTGTLSFTSAPNANGTATVTVHLHDNGGTADGGADTSEATTFTITVRSVNDPPVATSDEYSTSEDTPLTIGAPSVLSNDTDVDGDALTAAVVATVQFGSLSLNADGSFTYTPSKDYSGFDSFTYKALDGKGGESNVVTVSITVTPVNDPPVATLDTAPVEYETTTRIEVLSNDFDVDLDDIRVTAVAKPLIGSAVLDAGGNILYTPRPGFAGADVFTYTISDPSGATATADVRITVSPKNKPPVAGRDTAETSPGVPVEIDVLANDYDPDGDAFSIWTFDQGGKGAVTRLPNGHFLYTPRLDFKRGNDTFTYTIVDARGATDVGRVAVAVR